MTDYVVGFPFAARGDETECGDVKVLLQLKSHPSWQKGKLNGAGGKIELEESAEQAMEREFNEETNHRIAAERWKLKVVLSGIGWRVFFFACTLEHAEGLIIHSRAYDMPEPIEIVKLRHVAEMSSIVNNLRWIIPLCLDADLEFPVYVVDKAWPGQGTTRAKED